MKKIIAITLIVICYALGVAKCFAELNAVDEKMDQPSYTKIIQLDKLKEDLDFLFKTIEEVHPDMYAYTSKEEFDPLREQLYKRINQPMSSLEFYKLTAPVVASLKSFHTLLLPFSEEYKKYARNDGKVFPLELHWDGSKVVLYKNFSTVPLPVGGTVLSINGKASNELFDSYAKCIASENKGTNPWYIENPIFLRSLLWLEFGQVEGWQLKIKSPKGQTKNYVVPALTLKQFETENPAATVKWEEHYQVIPQCDAAVIKFYKWREPEELKAFFESSFKDIYSKNISNVIIDIRENTGGRDDCFHSLLEHLASNPYRIYDKVYIKISEQAQERIASLRNDMPDKFAGAKSGDIVTLELSEQMPPNNPHKFNGRVFVLVGRQSFSASTVFSSLVKCFKIATLIGEETGDPTTLYADSIMFKLPNSQIEAGAASKLLICACGKADGRGALPDYEIKQKPEDTAKGIDTTLQFTLNLIKTGEAEK